MNVEEQLKHLIIGKYGSILKFSKEANIPYSTIVSVFERGIRQTTTNTFFRLCDILNLSMEDLDKGVLKEKK